MISRAFSLTGTVPSDETIAVPRSLARQLKALLDVRLTKESVIDVDLHDLYLICLWFVEALDAAEKTPPATREELQDFVVRLRIEIFTHLNFHRKSMARDVIRLEKILFED